MGEEHFIKSLQILYKSILILNVFKWRIGVLHGLLHDIIIPWFNRDRIMGTNALTLFLREREEILWDSGQGTFCFTSTSAGSAVSIKPMSLEED